MRKIAIMAALAAATVAQPAFAQAVPTTDTEQMQVTLQVLNSCSLDAPDVLAFGTLTTLTNAKATGTATVNCTDGAVYDLEVGDGSNFNAGTRHMSGPNGNVAYYIELGTSGTDELVGQIGSGADQEIDFAAYLDSSVTSVKAGDYTDTVVVSLTY